LLTFFHKRRFDFLQLSQSGTSTRDKLNIARGIFRLISGITPTANASDILRATEISVKNYMSYKPQNEKAEIAFQSGGKILTALTRFE